MELDRVVSPVSKRDAAADGASARTRRESSARPATAACRLPPDPTVRRQLEVGPVDDPAERQADRWAQLVVGMAHRATPPPRVGAADRGRILPSTAPGRRGGPVDERLAAGIHDQRSSGRKLPSRVRRLMESSLGASFGDVRIHTDANAAQTAQELGATAFTSEHDVFFAPGAYRPQTPAGLGLLAHELTHVRQQHAPPSEPKSRIQRAVGFEFEDQSWSVFRLQPDYQWLRDPESYSPFQMAFGGYEAPTKSNEDKRKERYQGENIYDESKTTSHINSFVGKFNLQTGPKKGALHKGVDYQIEPDGPYSDVGPSNRMDLEIVTEPFPESAQGKVRLQNALADLATVFSRYDSGATGEWNGDAATLSHNKFVGPGVHQFTAKDIYLYGGKPGGFFKPQVTAGIPLARLPHVMQTLGVADPWVTDEEQSAVRGLVYGADYDPVDLANNSASRTIGAAPLRAQRVIQTLSGSGAIDGDAEGISELKGFLALVITYVTVLSDSTKDGVKNVLPLMSRYSFATLWKQVPDSLRAAVVAGKGLEMLMRALDGPVNYSVATHLRLKYKSVPKGRADQGMMNPLLYLYPSLPEGFRTPLASMTRQDWLWSVIVQGKDMLDPEAFISSLRESPEGKETADKYDKSYSLLLRGHANTKNVKDVPDEPPEGRALLENRNVTNGPMNFAQATAFAKAYFEWMWYLSFFDIK